MTSAPVDQHLVPAEVRESMFRGISERFNEAVTGTPGMSEVAEVVKEIIIDDLYNAKLYAIETYEVLGGDADALYTELAAIVVGSMNTVLLDHGFGMPLVIGFDGPGGTPSKVGFMR